MEIGFGGSYGWYLSRPASEFYRFETEPTLLFVNPFADRLFSPRIESGWKLSGEIDGDIREGTVSEDGNLVFTDKMYENKNYVYQLLIRPLLIVRSFSSPFRYYGLAGLDVSFAFAAHQTLYKETWNIGDSPVPFKGICLGMKLGGGIDYSFRKLILGIESDFSFFLGRLLRSTPQDPLHDFPGNYVEEKSFFPPVFSLRLNIAYRINGD